ncbi:TIR domain-containing protein [Pseudomonas gingeri]
MKFFLSHSSADKHIVSKVYEQLGAALCHYDVATFDNTSFLPEQIYAALNESTHFVLFASKKALESDWVKGELRVAFTQWMKAKIRNAMVFIINDGERSEVPSWLQDYVIIEHPSAHHISCRILSAFDDWEGQNGNEPPFYRFNEAMQLEKQVSVEPSKLPTTLMLCGTDGYSRKQLVNELFKRRFSGIAKRKLYFALQDHDSDANFYRHILGITSLHSPLELSAMSKQFIELPTKERHELIAQLIMDATKAGQALYVDVGSVGLDDSGKLTAWLEGIVLSLPRTSYPRLVLISARRPVFLTSDAAAVICLQKVEPLPSEESKLLFSWWLNKLNVQNTQDIVSQFIEYVDGRPKSIEIASRTLATVEPSQLSKQRVHIARDIQSQASALLKIFSENETANSALAIIAYSGYISEVDLIESLKAIPEETEESVNQAISLLLSYGFILQDSISIKLPGYLARVARDILSSPEYAKRTAPAINYLIEANNNIDLSQKTTISTIEDFCITKLRNGEHSIIGVESLILPSQCFRLARMYYDNQDYEPAYNLCDIAYRNRLALTDESALEVLRFKGLSAARLNNQSALEEVLSSFSRHKNTIKSRRLHSFIKGFNLRLSGDFDNALMELTNAYNNKGEGDIHILRELSFLHYSSGDLENSERLIRTAYENTDNNSHIIQMLIRVLLSKGKPYVTFEQDNIIRLINSLEASQGRASSLAASITRAELHYIMGDTSVAKGILESLRDTTPIKLLKAKIQIKEGKFSPAKEALIKLKNSTLMIQEGQRQSSIPETCHLIIEAAAAISLNDGLNELERNLRHLPAKVLDIWRRHLTEEFAFQQIKPNAAQKRLLGIS